MKITLLKYFLLIFGFLLSVIIYLSGVGIETDRFNNQIKNKLMKIDKKLNLLVSNPTCERITPNNAQMTNKIKNK